MVLMNQKWFSITKKYFVNDFKKLILNLKGVYNGKQIHALMNVIEDGKYTFQDTPLILERFKTKNITSVR